MQRCESCGTRWVAPPSACPRCSNSCTLCFAENALTQDGTTCTVCGWVRHAYTLAEQPGFSDAQQASLGSLTPKFASLSLQRAARAAEPREDPARRRIMAVFLPDSYPEARIKERACVMADILREAPAFQRPRSEQALAAALLVLAARDLNASPAIQPVARAAGVSQFEVAGVIKRIQRAGVLRGAARSIITEDVLPREGWMGLTFRAHTLARDLALEAMREVVFGGRAPAVYVSAAVAHALQCPRLDRRHRADEEPLDAAYTMRVAARHAGVPEEELRGPLAGEVGERVCRKCKKERKE